MKNCNTGQVLDYTRNVILSNILFILFVSIESSKNPDNLLYRH